MINKKMLILGGDFRQLSVAEEFIKDGYKVSLFAFSREYLEKPFSVYDDFNKAVSENEIIIMGIPVSKDNLFINTPLYDKDLYLKDLIEYINNSHIIIGGMISDDIVSSITDKGARVFDYYLREELIVRNVIPTVEGAIAIAMEETPYTLHSSNCLVCGFGRIGKLLAKTLSAFGANVTVSARKLEDLAWADCYSYKSIKTCDIINHINNFDIIFNTIPHVVLDKESLKRVRQDSLIIDLASKPGGIDFKYANLLGIKTIWALSLPGKVAPHTAGKIIKNTIRNILIELGV